MLNISPIQFSPGIREVGPFRRNGVSSRLRPEPEMLALSPFKNSSELLRLVKVPEKVSVSPCRAWAIFGERSKANCATAGEDRRSVKAAHMGQNFLRMF